MVQDASAIEPVPTKRYLVESRDISPYRQGFLEIEISDEGIRFRWYGDPIFEGITPWAQIVAACGMQNDMLRDDLKFLRADAFEQGYRDGSEAGKKAAQA